MGARPISEIRRADVKELIRSLHKTAPIAANRLLSILKTFFSWAAEEELIEASPAAAVKPLAREIKRDRVLADAEIRAIWQTCGELGAFGRAFRFMLATGARRSEVGAMTWREVSLAERLWTLPRERTKADRGHEIPLSDIALATLEECPKLGDFVFTTSGTRPISGWSKAKAALDKLMSENARALAQERGEDVLPMVANWRLHDLRRTCATHLARCGVDRIVIGKILNHAENEVTAIYDRHRYDREKRAALDRWSERLAGIVAGAGKSEADVIVLAKAIAR